MKLSRRTVATALATRSLDLSNPDAMQELGREIAAYLLAERRTGELDSLLRDIMQYRADHGIVEVTAVSAFDLSVESRDDIEREIRQLYPEVRQIIISPRIDPDVIGGVKLEFANARLDLSIQSKLNRLRSRTGTRKER